MRDGRCRHRVGRVVEQERGVGCGGGLRHQVRSRVLVVTGKRERSDLPPTSAFNDCANISRQSQMVERRKTSPVRQMRVNANERQLLCSTTTAIALLISPHQRDVLFVIYFTGINHHFEIPEAVAAELVLSGERSARAACGSELIPHREHFQSMSPAKCD